MKRWRILALLFAARVGLGFQFQTMGAVCADLSDAFGLDNAQIGLMIALFMLGFPPMLGCGPLSRNAPRLRSV